MDVKRVGSGIRQPESLLIPKTEPELWFAPPLPKNLPSQQQLEVLLLLLRLLPQRNLVQTWVISTGDVAHGHGGHVQTAERAAGSPLGQEKRVVRFRFAGPLREPFPSNCLE